MTKIGGNPEFLQPRSKSGRKKGVPNKLSTNMRMLVLNALHEAHPDGAVAYLREQAKNEPVAFLGLVGKCLPKEFKIESDVNVRQLNVHRLDISNLSDDELDALEGAIRKTYMIASQKVIESSVVEEVAEDAELLEMDTDGATH